jgi:hypothetical protein
VLSARACLCLTKHSLPQDVLTKLAIRKKRLIMPNKPYQKIPKTPYRKADHSELSLKHREVQDNERSIFDNLPSEWKPAVKVLLVLGALFVILIPLRNLF